MFIRNITFLVHSATSYDLLKLAQKNNIQTLFHCMRALSTLLPYIIFFLRFFLLMRLTHYYFHCFSTYTWINHVTIAWKLSHSALTKQRLSVGGRKLMGSKCEVSMQMATGRTLQWSMLHFCYTLKRIYMCVIFFSLHRDHSDISVFNFFLCIVCSHMKGGICIFSLHMKALD